MSELVTRLRRRAHLPEFRICGEAADALEAAEQERDTANRRYEQLWKEREWDLREGGAELRARQGTLMRCPRMTKGVDVGA